MTSCLKSDLASAYRALVNRLLKKAMATLALASLFNGFMDILVGLCGYVVPSYVFGLFMVLNGIGLIGIAYAHSSGRA